MLVKLSQDVYHHCWESVYFSRICLTAKKKLLLSCPRMCTIPSLLSVCLFSVTANKIIVKLPQDVYRHCWESVYFSSISLNCAPRVCGVCRRSLAAVGPRMSKEERRQLFEAQVKAEDELNAELQRQQEVLLQQQQAAAAYLYQQDPAFAALHGLAADPSMQGAHAQGQ